MRSSTGARLLSRFASGVAGAVVALAIAAPAAPGATATIEIRDRAPLIAGGSAALVFVAVTCSVAPGETLLEGNLSLSQDGGSGLAGLNPRCDGRTHLHRVRVSSFGGSFVRGPAFASAFLLFIDEASQTTQAQASATIALG